MGKNIEQIGQKRLCESNGWKHLMDKVNKIYKKDWIEEKDKKIGNIITNR